MQHALHLRGNIEMSGTVNTVVLVGHLGGDPETHTFEDGNMICNLSLATSESWKDKKGEWQEKTTWHRIVTKGKPAEYAAKNLGKGRMVSVVGKIDNRSYKDTKTGDLKYVSEVVVGPFDGKIQGMGPKDPSAKNSSSDSRGGYEDPGLGSTAPDEDIPF